jgi:pimeloyl-ACP methyl ester carboxylesterase
MFRFIYTMSDASIPDPYDTDGYFQSNIEGTIPFIREGEAFETYYKIFGDLNTSTTIPIVVVHGGPGLSHDYLLPISDLSAHTPVIFYDQIGNARSSRLKHKEFENLVKHFELHTYDFLGHSWGAMMGCELLIRRNPTGLRRFVNSMATPTRSSAELRWTDCLMSSRQK